MIKKIFGKCSWERNEKKEFIELLGKLVAQQESNNKRLKKLEGNMVKVNEAFEELKVAAQEQLTKLQNLNGALDSVRVLLSDLKRQLDEINAGGLNQEQMVVYEAAKLAMAATSAEIEAIMAENPVPGGSTDPGTEV